MEAGFAALDYHAPAMKSFVDAVVRRLLPALLTAAGVVLVTAGLLSYADPNVAGAAVPDASGEVIGTLDPSQEASASPSPSTSGGAEPVGRRAVLGGGRRDREPAGLAGPGDHAAPGRAVATRVVIRALNIDLPVVKGPDGYPYCGVAMYLGDGEGLASKDAFGQPGEGRATYLYAHARRRHVRPDLRPRDGQEEREKLLGKVVEVYYERLQGATCTRSASTTCTRSGRSGPPKAVDASKEQLWLQTSEGPKGTPGKTELIAYPISPPTAAEPKEAVPRARAERCG